MICARLSHWTKLALSPRYRADAAVAREIHRLRTAPRHTPMTSRILGPELELPDGASFASSYEEIFGRGIYAFPAQSDSPAIVDCGANVGLSILWFKRHHPKCRIVAFEADPAVFDILRTNLRRAGHEDVTLVNKAVWDADTEIEFAVEGADAGRIARGRGESIPKRIAVPAVRLGPFLAGSVDFLKIDIEGAETAVLIDCADSLRRVRSLFVEYHSFAHEEQRLDELLRVLRNAGFRVRVQTQHCAPNPYAGAALQLGMDLQLNIFGTRV